MLNTLVKSLLAAALASCGTGALAEECATGLICAERPQSVADGLQASGYKAMLDKNEKTGNPKVSSAANGYNFTVYFYGCKEARDCSSLSFVTIFEKDSTNTPALANQWNRDNRFSQMAVQEDGTLAFSYDVTTVGGLNKANFADVVDWWQTMLGQASKFFKEHPAK